MVVFSVLYPASEGARFDWTYYHETHLPLVKEAFADKGLQGILVLKGVSAGDGGPAPYTLMAHLSFDRAEDLQACLTSPRAAEVFADIANFTDIAPITQVSSRSQA